MPIMNPAARSGASLVMALRPTGLRQSSPRVCRKYVPISHQMPTCAPCYASFSRRAPEWRKPSRPNSRPRANLAGLEGSSPRRFSASHSQANTGASATTKIGCTNWNQPAGNSQPEHACGWCLRSANRFSDEPACSNEAQKSAEATNSTRMAAERLRSSSDQPARADQPGEHRYRDAQQRPSLQRRAMPVAVNGITPDAPRIANSAKTPNPPPTARMALRFWRRSSSGSPVLGRVQAGAAQVFAAQHVLDQAGQHAERRPPRIPAAN